MRFKRLDLNLLVALDLLLETRSVSQAATRMNLSQPAMSSALARLREYFGDELLVADGKRLYPTPYAELLMPRVRDCLGRLDALVSSPSTFEPSTSQRRFSIICSDYIAAVAPGPPIGPPGDRGPEHRARHPGGYRRQRRTARPGQG